MSSPSLETQDDFLPSPVRKAGVYFILAFIVFIFYVNAYENVFLFDDNLLIQLNSYLPGWSHVGELLTRSTTSGVHIVGGFYRPVQMILYLFAFHLGGGTEFWFHTLNMLLHIANTCLVYKLGTKLDFDRRAVFLGALVWGVHPLFTEAVTYMSATADPLFALFCLLGIIVLLPDFTRHKLMMAFPLFLLGLGSKETTVMFPLLVMVCLFLTSPRRLDFRTYLRTLPYWIVSISYIVWRTHASGFDGPQSYSADYDLPQFGNLKLYAAHPMYRIYTFFATLPAYLNLTVYPTGLHMERSITVYSTLFAGPVLIGLGMCFLAAGQIVRSARHPGKQIELSWGLLWFGAAHAPDTGILVPINSLFLEHWMYLPLAGLFLGIAQTIAKFVQKKPRAYGWAAASVAVIFAGCLAAKTFRQNEIWRNPGTFYPNIFAYGEVSARAHNNLALYYSDQGRYADAIVEFKKAMQISDIYAETPFNLGLTYLRLPPNPQAHIDEAIDSFKHSIQVDPNFYRSYNMLGEVYETLLNDPETAAQYRAKGKAITDRLQ